MKRKGMPLEISKILSSIEYQLTLKIMVKKL